MKKFLLAVSIFLLSVSGASAHSGRTDSSGCHNCRVGSCAGEYHCHNGGSGGSRGGSYGYIPPAPAIEQMPHSTATNDFIANDKGSYTVIFDWTRPDGGQWSVALSKVAGADPGPKTDTTQSKFTFYDVKPGKWYVNIKEGLPSGYWSDVSYWKITVPAWVKPTPTPTVKPIPQVTSEPTPIPASSETSTDDDSGTWITLGVAGIIGAYWWGKRSASKKEEA